MIIDKLSEQLGEPVTIDDVNAAVAKEAAAVVVVAAGAAGQIVIDRHEQLASFVSQINLARWGAERADMEAARLPMFEALIPQGGDSSNIQHARVAQALAQSKVFQAQRRVALRTLRLLPVDTPAAKEWLRVVSPR